MCMVHIPGKMQTLTEYRAANGLTQAQFAALIPTEQGNVSRWETGKAFPSREHIQRIDEVTGGAVPPAIWFQSRAAE